jgi:DNA-binding transcriptional regulator GbsR (MarR family)
MRYSGLLTAKVFAYLLVVQPNDGLSFGEMVDIFKVSKSSVSNSLNQLMQYGYIILYKVGSRKRRYKVTSQYLEIRLRKIKENLLREKYLTDKIIQCDCGKENISDRFNYAKVDVYLNHLNITIDNLTSTIDKLDKVTHSI